MIPVNIVFLFKDTHCSNMILFTLFRPPFGGVLKLIIPFSSVLLLFSCNPIAFVKKQGEKQLKRKGVQAHILSTKDFTMNYWKGGNGPVILFLHGFGGDAQFTYQNELLALAKTHTVIAPDFLWFGGSSANLPTTIESQVMAIEALLNELKVDTFSMIGQSYGGFVAVLMVEKFPNRIDRLCIANSPGPTFNKTLIDEVCRSHNFPSIEEAFVFDTHEGVQPLMNLASHSDTKFPKWLLKRMYTSSFSAYKTEQRGLLSSLMLEPERPESIEALKKMKVMVLWGEHDELFYLSEGQRFANEINANFVMIKDVGHAPQMDDRKAFTSVVTDFFTHNSLNDETN
jgi:pimeloyl-ACP methyl ester carboxylesterase